jgi:hypothetical protein
MIEQAASAVAAILLKSAELKLSWFFVSASPETEAECRHLPYGGLFDQGCVVAASH